MKNKKHQQQYAMTKSFDKKKRPDDQYLIVFDDDKADFLQFKFKVML